MNELNKKLAEWAGFMPRQFPHHIKSMGETFYYDAWLRPDGTHDENLPDFTESLDACFKYLVPRIKDYSFNLSQWSLGEWNADLEYMNKYRNPHSYIDNAETPALALCKAIEKLINNKGE